MKENIKSIKNLPDYEKTVYCFDKKGKRFEKKVKVTDNYLVTMRDGSSVCLTKQQLSFYGVNCVLPNDEVIESQVNEVVDPINDELEEEQTQQTFATFQTSSSNLTPTL